MTRSKYKTKCSFPVWSTAGTVRPLLLHVDQDRRRRHVPVRRIVVHELMEPLQFAGLRVKRDERIAVQIAARDGTVRIAGRAEHETGRFHRP